MQKSALLVQKASDFLKYIVCPHGQGEWGSIFRHFVRTFLYGRLGP